MKYGNVDLCRTVGTAGNGSVQHWFRAGRIATGSLVRLRSLVGGRGEEGRMKEKEKGGRKER